MTRNTRHLQQKGSSTMRPRSILTSTTAALGALLIAGCGVFAPDSSDADASSSTPPPVVEAEEHSTGLEHLSRSHGQGPLEHYDTGGVGSGPATAAPPQGSYSEGGIGPGPAPETDRPTDMGISENRAPAEVEDGVIVPDDVDLSTVHSDRKLTQRDVDIMSRSFELHAVCTDDDALAANAGHQPAGWPAGHQQGEPLPDPECHPDFIEKHEWEHYDTFHACCEGRETSTVVTQRSWDAQREYQALWGQSQARANWSPENDDRVENW